MDKKEIVDQALSRIDVNYVEEAIRSPAQNKRRTVFADHPKRYLLFVAAAAVLMLLVGGIYTAVRLGKAGQSNNGTSFSEFIDLVKTAPEEERTELTIAFVQVGNRVAQYELLYMSQTGDGTGVLSEYASADPVNEETVKDFVGDLYIKVPLSVNTPMVGTRENEYRTTQNYSWYRIKGSSDLRYLIREGIDGKLSIWEHISFQAMNDGN